MADETAPEMSPRHIFGDSESESDDEFEGFDQPSQPSADSPTGPESPAEKEADKSGGDDDDDDEEDNSNKIFPELEDNDAQDRTADDDRDKDDDDKDEEDADKSQDDSQERDNSVERDVDDSDDEEIFKSRKSKPKNVSSDSEPELDELHKILNDDDVDSDDEPVAGPSKPKPVEKKKAESEIESEDEDRHQGGGGGSSGMVYDFDIMLQKKKAQSKRRKKKAGDIINDDDDIVAALLNDMKKAAEEDFAANKAKKPSMSKLKMLPVAAANLMKVDYRESLLDTGVLHVIATWLSVMPDGSMPSMKIRSTMLNILNFLNTDDIDMIKSSGLGKVVMFMFKNPKETKENKVLASKLITGWSKNIFNIETEPNANLREERERRDYEAQQLKRRYASNDSVPDPKRMKDEASAQLRPGEKGWIPRARVPAPSMKDYVVRPESKIDIDLSKSGGKKEVSRLEKHIRAFKEKKKHSKTGRMFTVSIEGRKM